MATDIYVSLSLLLLLLLSYYVIIIDLKYNTMGFREEGWKYYFLLVQLSFLKGIQQPTAQTF